MLIFAHEGKDVSVESSVTRHDLAHPILQAKWKPCSSQQGLLAQAECHTNCSDTASGSELTHVQLTQAEGTCACLERTPVM